MAIATTIDWCPYAEGSEDSLRDETLRCMLIYGVDNVRGWRYVDKDLSEAQRDEAFELVCEKYNLCRHCGKYGHDESHCFETRHAAAWCVRRLKTQLKRAATPLKRAATL
jgi:hypothetical protein